MRLTDVVSVSTAVGATRSRLAKVAAIAGALGEADGADEVRAVVAFLAGAIRQGRIGAGWRSLADLPDPAPEPRLTVTEVDAAFTEIGAARGTGSAATRAAAVTSLFGAATADEQRFLRALVTGELRQGALEGVMLDAVAKAAAVPADAVRRAFMLSGRLPETAATALAGGVEALNAVRLELGRPVRPMLASPGSSVAEAVADLSPCVIEYKLDGARIQVHKVADEVHIYTRTLREITDSVPELVDLVRKLPCRSVVLDGETLALTDEGRPRPFQQTQSRFGSTTEEQVRALLLSPYFFDCLHLDGEDLIDEPLSKRNVALRRAVGDHTIPGAVDPPPIEAEAFGASALAAGHEGVMVKSLDSTYQAGRRGKAWLKVKPVHTLDLVVIGAEWGHGRRTGLLSNLHLGARDPDGGPPVMVGKTFKGLTDELLRWQTEEFPKYQREADEWTVYLRPELVVEIALDGVQASTRYPGGVALRFARVVRYRPDKQAADADTIVDVRGLLPAALG
ncbi:ATP-dependent DNA ligase [Alloactinosynnema sp. L-07]|uniref:ATP-dependent DNA ligase n=1 Tax=Alloactinosynnema sp. L-07 TaxID=1653480 RepID=UPI00065EF4F4|nr:ATP-dependent DNA ligase [Alloactinosynnema sp. L-07]CRK61607.1 ATP-dependent DNA ligase [Alloactinosynnema sp. L-07]